MTDSWPSLMVPSTVPASQTSSLSGSHTRAPFPPVQSFTQRQQGAINTTAMMALQVGHGHGVYLMVAVAWCVRACGGGGL